MCPTQHNNKKKESIEENSKKFKIPMKKHASCVNLKNKHKTNDFFSIPKSYKN
jgi:hypothetical protein